METQCKKPFIKIVFQKTSVFTAWNITDYENILQKLKFIFFVGKE